MDNEQKSQIDTTFLARSMPALELTSKAATVFAVLIYAVGYLVTSLHYSDLGITGLNPFKPKVAAAGMLFFFFIGLSVWLARYISGSQIAKAITQDDEFDRAIWLAGEFLVLCAAASTSLTQMFVFDFNPTVADRICYAALMAILVSVNLGAFVSERARSLIRKRRPIWTTIVSICVLYILGLSFPLRGHNFGQRHLTFCIFFIGVLQHSLSKIILDPQKRRTENWPLRIVQLIAPTLLFPIVIYPRIDSGWGGGAPQDAVVLFGKDSDIAPGQQWAVHLIDENDAGFYVSRGTDKRSIFISRKAVAAIISGSSKIDAQNFH